ncbi:hypothetical protein JCM3766R1_002164 [Sporobolomyces carnicolor]
MTRLSLLYGLGHAWPKFNPVNDTIRGGRSESHFATSNPSFATFSGVLDITALGGAGFASQSTTFAPDRLSLPAGAYSGLSLSLSLPSTRYDDEEKPDSTPTNYVLVLKNTKPETRPDGRRESVTSYEFAFDTKDVLTQEKSATGHRVVVRVDAEWNAFEATYRGRPQKDAPPLDPSCIYELSFMCRSNFGQQSGRFSTDIVSLSAMERRRQSHHERLLVFFARVWQRLTSWVYDVKSWATRRDGTVRLG